MSLSGKIIIKTLANLVSALDLASATVPLANTKEFRFGSGTGAGQVNNIFSDSRTLAASGSEELDLAGGLTNALGAVLTFTKVKALIVYASAANANDVNVGGAAVNACSSFFGGASDVVAIKPGGAAIFVAPDAAGFAVTAGTGDLLKVANGGAGTGVDYDIIILGVE